MKTNFFSIILTCFIVTSVFTQAKINNYKYVIVPKKFDFLKEKDQYQLNSLTNFLFNKYGFEAVMEGSDYPKDLQINRCLALNSDVFKDSGMFRTKIKIELKDCNDKLVFTSEIGESREKEYKTAYNLALRDAFKSIEALNYKYASNKNIASIITTPQTQTNTEVSEEIQQLRQEIQNLKNEKQTEVAVVEPPKVGAPQPQPVSKIVSKEITVIEGVSNVLYAQEIDNGFQLVDSSPKVVYRIKNTNLKDVFLVEGTSAIIYKKGDDWVLEYYSDNTLEQNTLNIKF
ncbi:MAG: hypothetical protein P8K68_03325 [Algibacter sp.]|uniref:hypothetical protein n=1 Tax=Algibacter sp. TaxID=1872428 RepID=UPI00262800B5|nr:hypothetical protein [Algibacter sp.]MDG1728764.1 hypothetical protein [Algibacter sp.]MDG2177803.1 hypothetical protein [Algibacter sp.]